MRWGLVLGLAVVLGVGCGSSRNLHSDGGTDAVSAAGGHSGGAGGHSASGGAPGAPGTGGSGSGGAGVADAGADAGLRCGNNFCTGLSYCCNPTCGVCAPQGALCAAQICGADASSLFDAFGCVAIPALDKNNCGDDRRPPHFYSCVISELPAPCKVLNIGDVTNTYCCP